MALNSPRKPDYPIHFDLKPDRLLMDSKFQGYKLSLDRLPLFSTALESDVDHASLTDEQYSIQHFKLQVFSNRILSDPWNPNIVYFIDQNWNVNKSQVSQQSIKLLQIKQVWNIPGSGNIIPGRYNVTLYFPDKTHAVLADGCGNFYLLFTDNRITNTEWKVLYQETPFSEHKNPQFVILDSIYYTNLDSNSAKSQYEFIDILLVRIDVSTNWNSFLQLRQDIFSSSNAKKTEHPFVSVVEWVTLSNEGDGNWRRKSSRTFVGRSSLDYASIETGGTGLFLASNDPFYCNFDSEKPLLEIEVEAPKKTPEYLWSQTDDKIIIWFQLPPSSEISDLVVEIKSASILIQFKNQVLLNGDLSNAVISGEAKWKLETDKLEISIPKLEKYVKWTCLIAGSEAGKEIQDTQIVEHIHNQLAHMCSDKWGDNPHNASILDTREIEEECDEFPADSALLMRIDRDLQKITHQTSLGSHQWLFSTRINSQNAPCICIRHDVDGLLWQPKALNATAQSRSNNQGQGDVDVDFNKCSWQCEHIATFSAFGYVQASKELKKFTVCPSDCSYVAICDSVKHIHVYRKATEIENDLRNRRTGEKISHISKQHVVSIDSGLEILGAYAGNDFMLILTAKNIIVVQMRQNEIV